MRLERIKLAGFKSFVDPIQIEFPGKRTAIVGPNGCGKSNVIDAVRWVMGEISAKHLRGELMSDVIFSGTDSRKAVGKASVDLVFDNSEGKLTGPYAAYNQIAIRREVGREGQSQYSLNGKRCRRRDVMDLFLGTGLGGRSYAIIEQGMISRLIEARPEELRLILEEAAGISRYKERRRETENRIRHTRGNLERLQDLKEELGERLDKLEGQATAAEQYKRLKERERRLERELAALRWQALARQYQEEHAAAERLETEREKHRAAVSHAETRITECREAVEVAAERFNTVQARYYELGAEVSRREQALKGAREQKQRLERELDELDRALAEAGEHLESEQATLERLESRLAELDPELAETERTRQETEERLSTQEAAAAKARQKWDEIRAERAEQRRTADMARQEVEAIDRRLTELAERRRAIEQEQADLAAEDTSALGELTEHQRELEGSLTDLQERLAEARDAIARHRAESDERQGELDEARDRLREARGRYASLESLQEEALSGTEGIEEWLERHSLHNHPHLAAALQVDADWVVAAEAVLAGWLEAREVPDLSELEHAVAQPPGAPLTLTAAGEPGLEDAHPAGWTPLVARIESGRIPAGVLEGVYCAADSAEAFSGRSQLRPHESLITPDGVWVGPDWLALPGVRDPDASVIARQEAIRNLDAEIHELKQSLAALELTQERTTDALVEAEGERDEVQGRIDELNAALTETMTRRSALEARRERIEHRREQLANEAAEIDRRQTAARAERQDRAAEAAAAEEGEAKATERETRAATERDAAETAVQDVRQETERRRAQSQELAVERERVGARVEALRETVRRLRDQQTESGERRAARAAELETAEPTIRKAQEAVAAALSQRDQVEQELGEVRAAHEAADAALREGEQQRKAAQEALEQANDALAQARLTAEGTLARRDAAAEGLGGDEQSLEALLAELPANAGEGAWRKALEETTREIEALGPINLAAIDEFQEQTERKRYLDEQEQDLLEALETLEGAIKRIDRETRGRFREVYEQVNGHLGELFPRLFGGGQAYLEMTGEDLLDTGVAIMARPPGKRVSNIHLLSGGEKALTAVALVFAIFELNPAPFCMLDEVDAPLDDANVGRFCDLVQTMSDRVQFIIITHNKTTMEMVDRLCGVTMQEPGVSRLVSVDVDEAASLAAS